MTVMNTTLWKYPCSTGFFPREWRSQGMNLANNILLVIMLRMHETIPKLLHAFSWCGISLSTRITVPQPTPWSRVILEKLAGFRQVKKFPTLHGTWRFMATFTRVQYLYLVTHYVISTHRMQDDQSFYISVSRSIQLLLSFMYSFEVYLLCSEVRFDH
jgi:hypothetical protein